MSVRRKIYSNLKGRIHGVNLMTALFGLEFSEARNELHNMISDGLVVETKLQGFPHYKLSFRGRDQANGKIRLVVDNDSKVV